MTLAERLLAIQAEYRSAIAEAESLKRQAAAKSPELYDALKSVRDAGASEDLRRRADALAEEIARLRDRADAISESAGDLKTQIAEMEAHLGDGGAAVEAEILAQIQALRQRFTLLHPPSASQGHGTEAEKSQDERVSLQGNLQQLRADYLRSRIESLANEYLATAHQLIDTGTELMALCGITGHYGNPIEVRLRGLEIPLPLGNLSTRSQAQGLRLDDQRIREMQKALDHHLATILNG